MWRRILASMPRRLRNWSYKDVTNFLREHGFSFFKEWKGSHQAWIKRCVDSECDRILEINFTHRQYPQGTLNIFIKKSGIDKSEWFKWGESRIWITPAGKKPAWFKQRLSVFAYIDPSGFLYTCSHRHTQSRCPIQEPVCTPNCRSRRNHVINRIRDQRL